jgi:hypothetical protein
MSFLFVSFCVFRGQKFAKVMFNVLLLIIHSTDADVHWQDVNK